jgi:hypothetical protein
MSKLSLVTFALIAGMASAQEKPRVYVTDSNSWETRSAVAGSSDGFAGASSGGARPQTAEVIKTFGQRCPQVIVNNRVDVSDYVVELDHEGGKGLLAHKDKIAVFVKTSGDSIFSKSTLSVGGSVQDACEAITKHWNDHAGELKAQGPASAAGTNVQSQTGPVSTTGSTKANTVIASNPSGADIEIDGSYVGSTPSSVQLENGEHEIHIKKTGFQDWSRKIKITGGTINVNADLEVSAKKQ